MSADYNFNKKLDGKGHMVAYAKTMERFDLSGFTVKTFASALKSGDLQAIKNLFTELSEQQQVGLLVLHIDYNDIEDTSIHNQRGFALQLARKFGHGDIADFFLQRKNELPSVEEFSLPVTRSYSARLFAQNAAASTKNVASKFNSTNNNANNLFGPKPEKKNHEVIKEVDVACGKRC